MYAFPHNTYIPILTMIQNNLTIENSHFCTEPAFSPVFGPHGHMVVQVVRQMIRHQVFAGHTDINRIPVLKFPPQSLQMLFGDVCLREWRCLKEDKVPYFSGHLLWPMAKLNEQL